MSVKLPLVSGYSNEALTEKAEALIVPTTIPSHGTIAGSVVFYLDEQLVNRGRIDDFKLLITDAHDETSFLEPVGIRDLIDEDEAETS
jgi:hypothetical protein